MTIQTVRSPTGLIEVDISSDARRGAAHVIYRSSDGALWIAGVRGSAYVLNARNLTTGRVEVITTVDGRNTLADEDGSARSNRGLVLGPLQTACFSGWRIDNQQTARFLFGAADRSVAARATGSAVNAGVIGFAAYRERESYAGVAVAGAGDSGGGDFTARGFGGESTVMLSSASAPGGSLGTGIGERQRDVVGLTSFDRAGGPDIVVINYDTFDALTAMGIIRAAPDAFPADAAGSTGYERYEDGR